MRYITFDLGLSLVQKNGEVGAYGTKQYKFFNGELVVGNTTANSAGNAIVPNLSATDGTALQILYPTASTDLGKVGLDALFFEAPDKTVAASTQSLDDGTYYKVIAGSIVFNGGTYITGNRFKNATGGSVNFTSTGTVRKDLGAEYWKQDDLDERALWYPIANLGVGDEATWDPATWGATEGVILR